MRKWKGRWLIIGIILLLDVYVFSALQFISQHAGSQVQFAIYSTYWIVSVLAISLTVLFPYIKFFRTHLLISNHIFAVLIGLFIAEISSSAFFLVDDIRRGIIWLFGLMPRGADSSISRSYILTWLGFGIGGGLFSTLIYGFSNKYNYAIKHIKLAFNNLPAAFKGLKIVQISDIHSGSLRDKEAVNKGVDLILNEKPDLILFTGDLVNDRAEEMRNYVDVFNRLHAPLGVFSILGNHDYGDYYPWPDRDDELREAERIAGRRIFSPMQKANIEKLKQMQAEMGWRLLMNEHVVLEKGGQQIALLGIENWGGKGRFPKYGRMDLAYKGTEQYPFKILMSHDPSHWNAQVRPEYPDVNLMLSGHTHGMQFGIDLPFLKWSPVKWMYKEWSGLYEEGNQKLYVNHGFGFLGYPGRVGFMPEITVIELA